MNVGFGSILLKNSVLKIADFSFAICRQICIVDMRRVVPFL